MLFLSSRMLLTLFGLLFLCVVLVCVSSTNPSTPPPLAGLLKQLTHLDVSVNALRSLPRSLVHCEQLRTIRVANNPVFTIPGNFYRWPALTMVECDDHVIDDLIPAKLLSKLDSHTTMSLAEQEEDEEETAFYTSFLAMDQPVKKQGLRASTAGRPDPATAAMMNLRRMARLVGTTETLTDEFGDDLDMRATVVGLRTPAGRSKRKLLQIAKRAGKLAKKHAKRMARAEKERAKAEKW